MSTSSITTTAATTATTAITVYPARKIITMNPMQPHATHVAVREGRVLAVGTLADMQAWGSFTLDERFAAKVLMPGLVEGHCHLKEGSMWDWTYLGWFDRRDPRARCGAACVPWRKWSPAWAKWPPR
jgi:predicted amidohydrolase YtcJ